MPRSDNPVQQEARDSLAKSARRLRALRGGPLERELEWEPGDGYPTDAVCFARVRQGRLILRQHERCRWNEEGELVWSSPRPCGVHYTSSFGADSECSFSGYLPGLTLEEAKLLVYQDAQRYW
jgi:hypothetical protein